VITESTVICETWKMSTRPPFRCGLRRSARRAAMRVWTKWVDEYFAGASRPLAGTAYVGNMVKALSDAEFEEKVAAIPVVEQQVKWRRAREGFPQDMLDEEMRKIAYSVARLDDHLRTHEWLVPGQFTLADICNFAIANGMQFGFSELVNKDATPGLAALDRTDQRAACGAGDVCRSGAGEAGAAGVSF